MAVPTYASDLTLIEDCEDVGLFDALGGGGAGMSDETDYFIQDTQCVSKGGFTADLKGFISNTANAQTIPAGDAIFVWQKQNNRNLMDIVANGGGQFIVGSSTGAYDHFYIDGSDADGSDLAGWKNYAIDPNESESTTTGGGNGGTFSYFGSLWEIGGSGSLKGNPNAMDAHYQGRELTIINGESAFPGTFVGAAFWDNNIIRRWGILTEVAGGYQFHGAFVMGTVATAVDFRDSDRNIIVLEDPFVASTFNEFEIRNSGSSVEWTNIIIQHLGLTSPSTMTLDVGTFTGLNNQWSGCGQTTFASTGENKNSKWTLCDRINLNEADISGSEILTPSVAADEGAVYDNRTTSAPTAISELDDCTFSIGANAHHAIRFGTNVDDDITLTGIEFTGFATTADQNNSTLRFDATSGSINVYLVNCTVDGSPASTINPIGIDDAAGITVTVVYNPVTALIVAQNQGGELVEGARVQIEAGAVSGTDLPFRASVSITRSGATATVSHTGHGMSNGDEVVIRYADQPEYTGNKTISGVTANSYQFTVSGSPASPATSSFDIFINGQGEDDYDGSPASEGSFSGGTLHVAGDVLTLGTGVKINVDAAGLIDVVDGQNQDEYAGEASQEPDAGTFDGGSGHTPGDDLTFANDVLVTVDDVDAGAVIDFSVDASGIDVEAFLGQTLAQTGSTGSGINFSLTFGKLNLTGGIVSAFLVVSSDQAESAVSGQTETQADTSGYGSGFELTPLADNIDLDFISSTGILMRGVTDANGELSVIKSFILDQVMRGWLRKSTASPFYKQSPVSFTLDSILGNTINVLLLDDE